MTCSAELLLDVSATAAETAKPSWIVSMPGPAMSDKLFDSAIQMSLAVTNINASLQTATDNLPKLRILNWS